MAELSPRDHGGNLDEALRRFGGTRADWIDLSTGINPVPYPVPAFAPSDWQALPDAIATDALITAARRFWKVPDEAALLAVPGASAAIAHVPLLAKPGQVHIPGPTYNEHAAAFARAGWEIDPNPNIAAAPDARVIVHPNNPTGRFHDIPAEAQLTIIDESFCDVVPERSMITRAARPDTLILKSFGKFWGLAGVRLGFVAGSAELIRQLSDMLGPWPVSGPALRIGTAALSDQDWATRTRTRLDADAARLDQLLGCAGNLAGGTPLFRLYDCADADALQTRLARNHIWTRTFPWSQRLIRLGLPAPREWPQLEAALS